MLKRIYLLMTLMAALGLGLTVANSETAQKDKQKDKLESKDQEKNKDQKKNKASSNAGVDGTRVFALPSIGGEGSYLGVFLEEVTAERMKELNLSEERGAIVMKVVEGSPAEKAGLKENDVIVSFNGRRVDSVRELQRLLSETPAERGVSIEVMRGGGRQTIAATLSKRSNNFNMVMPELNGGLLGQGEEGRKRAEEARKRAEEFFHRDKDGMKILPPDFGNFTFVTPGGSQTFRGTRLGITAESLTDQLSEYFGVKDGRGVLITEVYADSAAAKAGLKAGDVITAVDDEKINDVTGLVTAITSKGEGAVRIKIMRNQSEQTITVTLQKRTATPATRRRAGVAASAFSAA
ncbi:MAG TPA: PDZ domain-containing protein [Blastocatellia bacterium]|nr:PDZ domain-containing protein [Blastocatellia bacterium]